MDQVVKFFGFFLFAHVRTFNFKNFGIVHYTGFRQIWFVTQNPFFNRKSGLSFSAFRRLAFSFRHFHNFFCQMSLFSNLYNLFLFISVSWSCRFFSFSFLTYSQNFSFSWFKSWNKNKQFYLQQHKYRMKCFQHSCMNSSLSIFFAMSIHNFV